jgi:hypothetical protein
MILGELIKGEIEAANADPGKVAAYADMSTANLYRIYKKDSCESKYLIKIAEYLKIPITKFFPNASTNIQTDTKKISQQVGEFNSGINMNAEKIMQESAGQYNAQNKEEAKIVKLSADLVLCTEKVKGLEKRVADKDEIIASLRDVIDLLKRSK